MANVIKFDMEDRAFVRFFSEYVDCDWCQQPTRGRVYEESQTITCSVCRQPLLEIDTDTEYLISFDEDDDGEP